MPLQIVGKSGAPVESSDNRLWTDALVTSRLQYNSLLGNSFSFPTDILNLSSSTNTPIVWIKNNNPNYSLQLSKLAISWNGGISGNSMLTFSVGNCASPTENYIAVVPNNLLTGETKESFIDYRVWNQVGSGMISNNIILGSIYMVGRGTFVDELSFVLRTGYSLLLGAAAETPGKCSITIFAANEKIISS